MNRAPLRLECSRSEPVRPTRHAVDLSGKQFTHKLLKNTLVKRTFWFPAHVKFLVVLFKALPVVFPLFSARLSELSDPVGAGERI